MADSFAPEITDLISQNLPSLRRYARALTGAQDKGDHYAFATLEAILADRALFQDALSPKVALFKAFQSIWVSSGGYLSDPDAPGPAGDAHRHLSRLTLNTREALLLHTIEHLAFDEVGEVLDCSATEAESLVGIAYTEMAKSTTGQILIIEDEAVIAMDLEAMVGEMGHQVTGVARTEEGAVALFEKQPADLILSDIQLADGSSGIDAVNRILADAPDVPVIFITAFPERLLTGVGPEPAFLISKPYTNEQVMSAVSQAMFFSSTETLSS